MTRPPAPFGTRRFRSQSSPRYDFSGDYFGVSLPICTDGRADPLTNLVEQMEKAGVQRLVCMTSVGVVDKPIGPLFYLWLIKPPLRHIYEDMRHMEQTIRESHLAWTIVRPSRLFNGKRVGQYRLGASGELDQANKISRADVANCLLNQLDTQANWQQAVAVAY